MKQYIKLSLAYVLCSYLLAQKIPINPNHSIYPYLYRQSTNGILPQWIQSARPLTIAQVLKSLNQIIESDKTNDNNRILAEQFLSEFKSPEDNGLNLPQTKNNKISDKVVIIKVFSSLTCPHCANFHQEVILKLKKEYIDTNRVKFEHHGFPLDLAALNAEKILYCFVDKQKRFNFIKDVRNIFKIDLN